MHTGIPYGNCLILSPDGKPVSRCKKKRLDWFLSRGLAKQVDEKTIILSFEPSSKACLKEAIIEKENKCVVCGVKNQLTKHHIVPFCFRNAMPVEWRSGAALYHDIVAACRECHDVYELEADKKKLDLSKKYSVPRLGFGVLSESARMRVRNSARPCLAYLCPKNRNKHYKHVPEHVLKEMYDKYSARLFDYFGYQPCLEKLKEIAEWNGSVKTENFMPYGKYILDQVGCKEIVLMWRKHFLEVMKPKFMPPYWDANRLPTEEEMRETKNTANSKKERLWKFYERIS